MTATPNLEQARRNMVLQQVRPWDVTDERVLEVIQQIPREHFVPARFQSLAFADTEIPLGHGCAMMAPRIEARMLQALNVQPGDRVLEIGTGSGFVTACLRALGGHVTSVELHEDFVETAKARLAELSIVVDSLLPVDFYAQDFSDNRFDVIAVTGSIPRYDERFASLLTSNGRLFVIVGEPPVMEALLIRRTDEKAVRRDTLFETNIAPLANAPAPARFVF